MLSSVTELHAYIDPGQLTTELGGTQEYCHDSWISHRTVRAPTPTCTAHTAQFQSLMSFQKTCSFFVIIILLKFML